MMCDDMGLSFLVDCDDVNNVRVFDHTNTQPCELTDPRGGQLSRKLTLTRTTDPIRSTRRGPDRNRTTKRAISRSRCSAVQVRCGPIWFDVVWCGPMWSPVGILPFEAVISRRAYLPTFSINPVWTTRAYVVSFMRCSEILVKNHEFSIPYLYITHRCGCPIGISASCLLRAN